MSGSWAQVADQAKLKPGDKYRLVLSIRAPFTPATTGALSLAFRAKALIEGLVIDAIRFTAPASGGNWDHPYDLQPFAYIVEFHALPKPDTVEAGISPAVVWSLVALVATATLGFFLSSKRLDHFVTTVGSETRATASTVLNPGLLLLAFAGLFLIITKAKG